MKFQKGPMPFQRKNFNPKLKTNANKIIKYLKQYQPISNIINHKTLP